MVTASPSFVFSKNGLPPLRPPYVCEHPSPATADRSLALGPFEEQPHQLLEKEIEFMADSQADPSE